MQILKKVVYLSLILHISLTHAQGQNCENFVAAGMNCFENNTPADANAVNANFKALLDKIVQLEAQLQTTQPNPSPNSAYAELIASKSGSKSIPFDNSIPQQNEGTEFLTVTITPQSSNSWLHVELVTWLSETSNHSDQIIGAIFRDAQQDAIVAGWADLSYNNIGYTDAGGANNFSDSSLVLQARVLSGSTAPTTFKFRAGCNGGGATVNGLGNTQKLGGSLRTVLSVVEIVQ